MKATVTRRYAGLLCLTMLIAPAGDATALAGIFYAEAKVKTESEIIAGLDPPTRDLIAKMPEAVRKEAVELIRQALPLIDTSMAKFLKDVDSKIEKTINHLVCSGQALGQGIAEEIRAAVLRSERPTPVRELIDTYDSRGLKFEAQSARQIAMDYEDFLQQAGITACRLVDVAGVERVDTVRILARERWRTWTEIENSCSTAADCLVKRYTSVRAFVAKADPRDVQKADAKQALARVTLIEQKPALWARLASYLGFESWIATSADWLSYEAELVKLRSIERNVSSATALRTSLAKRYFADATSDMLTAEQNLVKAKGKLSDSLMSENDTAKREAGAAIEGKKDLIAQVEQAIAGDPSLKDAGDTLRKRIDALDATAQEIAKSAATKNDAIAAAAARQKALREQASIEAEIRRAEMRDRRAPR